MQEFANWDASPDQLIEAAARFSDLLQSRSTTQDKATPVSVRGGAPTRGAMIPSAVTAALSTLERSHDKALAAAQLLLEAGSALGHSADVQAALVRPQPSRSTTRGGGGMPAYARGGQDASQIAQALVGGLMLMMPQLGNLDLIIKVNQTTGVICLELGGRCRDFPLGTEVIPHVIDGTPAIRLGRPPAAELQELSDNVATLQTIKLSECVVVGKYLRHDEKTRNQLIDRVRQIQAPLRTKTQMRENFLIWAAPGSGKTFLIEQIAKQMQHEGHVPLEFLECNLAKDEKDRFVGNVNSIPTHSQPVLCLLDEIDARNDEQWPYETCFPKLDLNEHDRDKRVVFVLIGSTENSVESLAQSIEERHKGKDLISRVPIDRLFEIPQPTTGDGVVMVAGELFKQPDTRMKSIEKLALFYILSRSALRTSPRQQTEFIKAAAARVEPDETRLRYHHLFDRRDPKDYKFLITHNHLLERLSEQDVSIAQ